MDFHIEISRGELDALKRKLNPRVFSRFASQSVNDAARFGHTHVSREIRKTIPLKAKDMKRIMHRTKATPENPTAHITLGREAVPMKRYRPKVTREGVTVKPRKGKPRELLRGPKYPEGAFVGKTMGGHVFSREGKARFPIHLRFGPTPVGVLAGAPGMLKAQEGPIRGKLIERLQSKIAAHLAGKLPVKT